MLISTFRFAFAHYNLEVCYLTSLESSNEANDLCCDVCSMVNLLILLTVMLKLKLLTSNSLGLVLTSNFLETPNSASVA